METSTNDNNDEYDDIYIVFDIPDFNLIENLHLENYSVIGLETERPIVKIDNFVFEGKFETLLMDTALCVEQQQHSTNHHNPHESPPQTITSRQILRLNRILLGPKVMTSTNNTSSSSTPSPMNNVV
ncbi:hypothetical protein C9374_010437 [Naegleria lovaniensis]|uniref:Transcription factor TFIIIC triple barrel domain-containing protein n=1 Tax=Naegleria lovaniensis TaxID=51637 RepID=A0AA88GGD6_NAELO|nr:uncharacterized protein C9374_010437 [Naegleria lovaniensis]KAG2374693.1 hypothetical protein C9374_010437 [Naegleria lovaniensis]